MITSVFLATLAVAALSLFGVLFFHNDKRLVGIERYVIPAAVGVFLALVFAELLPETIAAAPKWGGVVIGASFVLVYVLAHFLHTRLHKRHIEHNEKQEAALLLLVGDALHNFADGVLIASAFLISPEAGIAVTLAVVAHELPQEIVEFGVLLRAGYSRQQALFRNFLSASTVVIGGLFAAWFALQFEGWLWLLTAFVAGNLLYIAASELLPRLHSTQLQSLRFSTVLMVLTLSFVVVTGLIFWSHENLLPEALHDHHGHGAYEADEHDHDPHDEEHEDTHDQEHDHHHHDAPDTDQQY